VRHARCRLEVAGTEAVREPAGHQRGTAGIGARPWGWALLGAAVCALITGVFAAWWAGPALVGGLIILSVGERPEGLLFAGSLLWAIALTGLPLAGRPAPLLSSVLAFAGTRAYRGWRKTRQTERTRPPAEPVPVYAGRLPLIAWIAWFGGLGGSAVLLMTWLGRVQMFPALDAALASVQLGAAAGLTVALGYGLSGVARRLVLLPLGLSLASMSVLFWWFVLAP